MNFLTVFGLLVCCAALGQALVGKPTYTKKGIRPIRYCSDYAGRPVAPGRRFKPGFYDGCNTCTCGSFGQVTACTKLCSDLPAYATSPQELLSKRCIPCDKKTIVQ